MNRYVLHLTKACNLNCVHCYWNCGKPLENELSTDEIFKLVDDITNRDPGSDLCLEGGEFFLRPDAMKIIDHINTHGMKPRITTNAALLTDKKLKQLRNKVFVINFSLDGVTPQTHDTIRQMPGLFKKVTSVIKNAASLGINTRISSVVMNCNRNELLSMPDLASKLGAQKLAFYTLLKTGRANENIRKLHISIEKRNEFWEKIFLIKQKRNIKMKILALNNLLSKKEAQTTSSNFHCVAKLKKRCDIGPDGKIYPCGLLVGSVYSLGSIRANPLYEILENSKKWSFWFNLEDNSSVVCKKCELLEKCKGGCPGLKLMLNDSLNSIDPNCCANYVPVCRYR